jgi:hypothetical protein
MQLHIFVTRDGMGAGTGPLLFISISPQAVLPPHPRALEWRYLATIDHEDTLLAPDRSLALAGIERDGFYIANRLL